MKRVIFSFLISAISHFAQGQDGVNFFKLYKDKADDCFTKQDFACALTNYQSALHYRPNDTYCKSRLAASRKPVNTPVVSPQPTQEEVTTRQVKSSSANLSAQRSKVLDDLYQKGQSLYYEQEYVKALPYLKKAAEQGKADAQSYLGRMYEYGDGVEQDYKQALEWQVKSAKQGNRDGQNYLGEMYARGHGVTQDYKEALRWFHKSAEQYNTDAEASIGIMYYYGYGVEKDYKQALQWFTGPNDLNNSDALRYIGEIYLNGGFGVEKNYEIAIKHFYRGATIKNVILPYCQYRLGFMYENGYGIEKNLAEAIKWYQKSAKYGNAKAQERLKELNETW